MTESAGASAKRPSREHGTTHSHDANGNRVAKSTTGLTRTFDHDSRGTLRRVTAGGTAVRSTVDGSGRRIARQENGTTTAQWLYRDGLRMAAELDGQGALRWRFVNASGRHAPDAAIDASGTLYRLVTDQVGSVRLVVRASDGAVMHRMRHDAWGKVEEDFAETGFARGRLPHDSTALEGWLIKSRNLFFLFTQTAGRGNTTRRWGGGWRRIRSGGGGGTTGGYEYVGGRPLDATDTGGNVAAVVGGAAGGALGPAAAVVGGAIGLGAVGVYGGRYGACCCHYRKCLAELGQGQEPDCDIRPVAEGEVAGVPVADADANELLCGSCLAVCGSGIGLLRPGVWPGGCPGQ
jgi:hypothetical protein